MTGRSSRRTALYLTCFAVVAASLILAFIAFPSRTSELDPPSSADVADLHNARCPFGGNARDNVFVDHEGLRVHLCCRSCVLRFRLDPERALAQLGIEDIEKLKRPLHEE